MRLPYFSRKFVSSLRANAIENRPRYTGDPSWLKEVAGAQVFQLESNVTVDPPPELLVGPDRPPSYDAENAKRIHMWLGHLMPTMALDERLWACLSHSLFPEYMAARWPAETPGIILRRYLIQDATIAGLTRNGIARLWWAGQLTRDDQRPNPFELTEILFDRQDIEVSLLERQIGRCRNVRVCVLEFLQANRDWLAERRFGDRIQALIRELNLLGGVAILDALSPPTLQAHLEVIARRVVEDES